MVLREKRYTVEKSRETARLPENEAIDIFTGSDGASKLKSGTSRLCSHAAGQYHKTIMMPWMMVMSSQTSDLRSKTSSHPT